MSSPVWKRETIAEFFKDGAKPVATANPLKVAIAARSVVPPTAPQHQSPALLIQNAEWLTDLAFTRMIPTEEYIFTFSPIQELYRHKKECFTITAPIHQANSKEPLHISVCYSATHSKDEGRSSYTIKMFFHINGYLKNDWGHSRFMITDITQQNPDGIRTIAEFSE